MRFLTLCLQGLSEAHDAAEQLRTYAHVFPEYAFELAKTQARFGGHGIRTGGSPTPQQRFGRGLHRVEGTGGGNKGLKP
ncbi:MAG: hypothetical protein M3256_02040, partial [Actinomycetota bacterium]|nr:hypothetical protein [Actinomycetota bacterium]